MAILALADSASADVAKARLEDASALNVQLLDRGLPAATHQAVTIEGGVAASAETGVSTGIVSAAVVVGFVVLFVVFGVGYYLVSQLKKHSEHKKFVSAISFAEAGTKARQVHLPPQLRRHYIAEEILGRGSFGCVLRVRVCQSEQARQAVAIKIMVPGPESVRFSPKDERRLKREARVLDLFTAKKCEYAVQLAVAGAVHIEPEVCWFVMELVSGVNLTVIFRDEGLLSDLECIRVARSVLSALKVMHAEGLVHRDIKPDNVMHCREHTKKQGDEPNFTVGSGHSYKLIDYGTVLGVDDALAPESMMTTSSWRRVAGAGTPPYMSPEMFREPETAKYPTDLWSLGVTLFQVATGKLPFQAESDSDSDLVWSVVLISDLNAKAPSVLELLDPERRAVFDLKLAGVIAKALEKHVEERYEVVCSTHGFVRKNIHILADMSRIHLFCCVFPKLCLLMITFNSVYFKLISSLAIKVILIPILCDFGRAMV